MKWLGGIITSLIVLALGTLFVAYLQPVVKAIAPEDGLKADVELTHWQESPKKSGVVERKASDKPYMVDIERDLFLNSDFYDFAAMTIENPTSKLVENIRVKLPPHKAVDALIVTKNGLRQESLKYNNDFNLPPMKPGDRTKLYMWGEREFPKVLVNDEIKTYSSLGPMQVTFSTPSDKSYYAAQKSGFLKFMDEWFGYIFAGLILFLCAALGTGMDLYGKHSRKLLSDPSFYTEEKQRFDADPKKFEPKITSL